MFSPRKESVGMKQNFISLDSPTSDARSSRIAIRDELAGKLVFDDPRVFERLALSRVPPQFVANCARAFQTDQKLLGSKRELINITANAEGKRTDELEVEEEIEDSFETRIVKKKAEEKKMYKPLSSIFQHVETFQDEFSSTQNNYSFESTDSTTMQSDSSTWGFPKGSPDFGMFERSAPTKVTSGRKKVLWRQSRGFCEAKPTEKQGPKSENPKIVKPLVCQAADYARLHLSARPFQLFSIGLLIFGSKFCVAIFDRGGVIISPIHDMWKDLGIFICVIRSLTCHLSPVELGQDPTVTTLSDEKHETWQKEMIGVGREAPEDFPTFEINMGGSSGRTWYTIGAPIWASVSMLGRGTSVWLVAENATGPVFVLKNTWRNPFRLPESTIYSSISGYHPAVAKFHTGQDVLFPGEEQNISVSNLRGIPLEEGDAVLHRLLLESRGRPLWEYRSENELLQGIRAALSGILHRDISVGNIMLPVGPPSETGAEGFLMDVEFARINRSFINPKRVIIPVPSVRGPGGTMTAPTVRSHTIFGEEVLRGAAMTGTAQFMAADILRAIMVEDPIEHLPQHDIESFIYVLAYCVTRRAVLESRSLADATRKRLHRFFYSHFGRMELSDIFNSRTGQIPLEFDVYLPGYLSKPMSELIRNLKYRLQHSRMPAEWNPLPLTHSFVLSAFDKAIADMTE